MLRPVLRLAAVVAGCWTLTQCGNSSMGSGNMGGPTAEERSAKIAGEPTGDFFYGRRYFVEKTRFWGYIRKPRQPWNRAKMVVIREDKKLSPDRMPENGPTGQRYSYDQNFEYRMRGYFTGKEAYDPNSNQFLPEFMLTGAEVVDRQPGWIFRLHDRYDQNRVTLVPR